MIYDHGTGQVQCGDVAAISGVEGGGSAQLVGLNHLEWNHLEWTTWNHL